MSFDIDSIDPFFAPHTGTAVRGGLNFREANYVCEGMLILSYPILSYVLFDVMNYYFFFFSSLIMFCTLYLPLTHGWNVELWATNRLKSMELVEVNASIHSTVNIDAKATLSMALTLISSSIGRTIL